MLKMKYETNTPSRDIGYPEYYISTGFNRAPRMCVIRYRRGSGGPRRPNHFPGCLFRPQSPGVQSRPIGLAKQHTLTHSYALKRFIHSQTDNTLKKGIEEACVLCTGGYIKYTFSHSTHLMCKTVVKCLKMPFTDLWIYNSYSSRDLFFHGFH